MSWLPMRWVLPSIAMRGAEINAVVQRAAYMVRDIDILGLDVTKEATRK